MTDQVVPSSRAKRIMGTYFDEFSRGVNPFGYIPTFGVANATDPKEEIAELFKRFGIVKVRGVYSAKESLALQKLCIGFSKLKPLDLRAIYAGKAKGFAGGAPVLNDSNFWKYSADPTLNAIVQAILGENTTEFGSSVAAHYSARGLHRDYRQLCEKEGSPYNISDPQKSIVRILHYCAGENMAGGMLGFIPFSHDENLFAAQGKRIGLVKDLEWFDTHRKELTDTRKSKNFEFVDEIDRHIVWVPTDPGDVLVTNSAMLHCGEYITGPRYFFVSSYTEVNSETLPMVMGQVKSDTAESYHRHLELCGFKGSSKVLRELEAKRSSAEPVQQKKPASVDDISGIL